MRTLIKIIIFLIVITIAGLIALPFFIDPNDYKEEISEQVKNFTGRDLVLTGDINLSVFPWIALELGPLALSNAAGFNADPFAKVEKAEIRIKLMPLLDKQLEMDTIVLDGLVLNLEKNADGKTNWDDLVENAEHADKIPESTEDTSGESSTALSGISIAGVQLNNANIRWADASKDEHFKLENVNLTTDPLSADKPTDIDFQFDLHSSKPQAKAHVSIQAKVLVDLESQRYALNDLKLETQAEGQDLPFDQATLALFANINADMSKQVVTVNDLQLLTDANKGEQQLVAELKSQIVANLDTQQFQLKSLSLDGEAMDPGLPDGKIALTLTSEITADLTKQQLSLTQLSLKLQEMAIQGNIKGNKILSEKPIFTGDIELLQFNPRKLANKMAIELPEMADPTTLTQAQVSTNFEASPNHFNATKLELSIDQSKLNGQLSVTDFSKPAIGFGLVLDEIDLDRYLPPVKEQQDTKAKTTGKSSETADSDIPLEPLRELNAKGTIDIGKLKINRIQTENIHLTLNADKGLIKLHPLKAEMYEGNYQGNIQLNAQGKSLKVAIDENIKNVQVGPLLTALSGDDKITGTANAHAKLSGTGINPDEIKSSLSGSGNFSFTDGALKGVNIAESIRQAKAAIKGQKLPASDTAVQTDFSEITGSFTAKSGIIQNKDLKASSPLLRINGAGTINLVKELLDYAVNASIVETSKGQGGKELADLTGLTIPVKITGNFDNPAVNVDLANLLKAQANKELQKKALEQADKLDLKEKYGVDLNDLLGGAAAPQKDKSESEPKPDSEPAEESTPAPSTSPEDQIKDVFKKFF